MRHRLARYSGNLSTSGLLAAARRSLERTGGSLSATVTVNHPDDAERKAIIGITGQYRAEGSAQIGVRLADLNQAIRESTGAGLIELLERIGPPLKDRPADRRRLADGREAMVRSAENSFLNDRDWYQSWLTEIAADGTLTRLVNAAEAARIGHAVRVLEAVERRTEPVQLAELAAATTGDTKALNHGTTLATLVLRALAIRAERRQARDHRAASRAVGRTRRHRGRPGQPRPRAQPGGGGDGLGEWLTDAKARGVPFYVTLQQLIAMPVVPAVEAEPTVSRLREPGRPPPRRRRPGPPITAAHLHGRPAVDRLPPSRRRGHGQRRPAAVPRRLRLAGHRDRQLRHQAS